MSYEKEKEDVLYEDVLYSGLDAAVKHLELTSEERFRQQQISNRRWAFNFRQRHKNAVIRALNNLPGLRKTDLGKRVLFLIGDTSIADEVPVFDGVPNVPESVQPRVAQVLFKSRVVVAGEDADADI